MKLTREEMAYEDALELVEQSLAGKKVNRESLATAIQLIQIPFSTIYLDRRDEAKLEEKFPEEIED